MSKKLLIANNEDSGLNDGYNHYYQTYTNYPLIVENDKLCTDHPSYITEIYGNIWQDFDGNGKNLFNKNTALIGYEFQSSASGDTIQANADWFVSEYIEVKPSTNYYISGILGATGVIFADKNKKYISGGGKTGFTTTSDTFYVRINCVLSHIDTMQVEEGTVATSYEPYHIADLPDIRSVGMLQEDGTYKVDIIINNQDSTETQTKSISLLQPLRAIGDYKDRLYWDNTLRKYCIEKKVDIPSNYDQVLDDSLVLSTPQIIETSITKKISLNTYENYIKVTTDELEVSPSNISGEFAEKEALE